MSLGPIIYQPNRWTVTRTQLGAVLTNAGQIGPSLINNTTSTTLSGLLYGSGGTVGQLGIGSGLSIVGGNLTATGGGGGSGTVTSVTGTGTVSGLTLSGNVTSSGNITLGGTLAVADGSLSSNVPLKNAANTFSGNQVFSGLVGIGGAVDASASGWDLVITGKSGLNNQLCLTPYGTTPATTSTHLTFTVDDQAHYGYIDYVDNSTTPGGLTLSVSGTHNPQLYFFAPQIVFQCPTVGINGTIVASNLSGTNTGDQTTITGNAGTATKLQTARTIAGVSFDGSSNIAIAASGLSNGVTGSGAVVLATSPTLTTPVLGTPASGNLANCTFPTLNQSTTGNAATATKLATARNINSVAFDGTADITVAAAAGTLTGTTLASGVTSSSLTSFGSSPTLVTPILGTPTSGTLTNCTGYTTANLSGTITNAQLAGSIAASKLVGTDIATVGTLTAGSTGAGFTIAFSTSTLTGTVPNARLGNVTKKIVTCTIGNGSAVPSVGTQAFGYIPYAGTITRVTLMSPLSGSAVVDVWKVAYASFPPTVSNTITASALPTLSSAKTYQDSTLTGWTTSVSAGDVIMFNLNSVTTCTMLVIEIEITLS